ncbi:kinase-like protein [Ceratobasidium sp. AG-I]|nr:kinase-like protein [Ceratobasidium sp. AG-I]
MSSSASHMLSEHASNPLQVGSSDMANAEYVRQVRLNASNKGKKVVRTVYAGSTPQARLRKVRKSRGLGEDESSDELQVHRVVGGETDDDPVVDGDAEADEDPDADDEPMNDLDAAADSTELVETVDNGDLLEPSDDPASEGLAAFTRPTVEPNPATSNPFYVSDGGDGDVTVTFSRVPGALEEEVGDEDAEGEDDEDYMADEDRREQEIVDIGDEVESEDEANTLSYKDEMEQPYINSEMKQLRERVRAIVGNYDLVDRLGEGTFSSVYKAIDLNFTKYNNNEWNSSAGYADYPLLAASSSNGASSSKQLRYNPAFRQKSRYFVAIKRIYVTSSPQRVANEIELMEASRGCRHVSQLITAFRDEDQVVCVMPYHRSLDFRDYFQTISIRALQTYFRHLFRALRDIHARDIMHRDVKPANFLFNPGDGPDGTGWGVLCDFGLAQRVDCPERTQCLHTAPTKEHPHGERATLTTYEEEVVRRKMQAVRKRSEGGSANVGYKTDDLRPRVKANRAGTRGFRAPEVLFKCEAQTVALDIWSAGIILLAFLSGKFPLFNSNDDTEALAEIAAIVGRERMEKCARLHNRTFLCNIPSTLHTGTNWRQLALKMNPELYDIPPAGPNESVAEHAEERARHRGMVDAGLDLLRRTLELDATKRITARDALYHPFLKLGNAASSTTTTNAKKSNSRSKSGRGNDLPSDDSLAPHPPGQGACSKLHWLDATDEGTDGTGPMWGVQLRGGGTRLVRGDDPEARCVGRGPCRYHVGWETWEGVGEDD